MIHEWDLTETNMRRLRERPPGVAVLPTSAIEAHNRHLPEGQDFLQTRYVARRCCEMAHGAGAPVICLPGLPYGVDCNLAAYPLSLHVSQATLDAMLREIILSLEHFGIRKTVLLNGHGGNVFTPMVRQLQSDRPVHVFVCDWWTVGSDRYDEIFDRPDDHAGEMETSVALALCPELVEFEHAGDGRPRPFRFEALRKGWVRTSRDFGKLNDHCAVGDPSQAIADKGRRYLDLVCERISAFLVELAVAEIDEHFPHTP